MASLAEPLQGGPYPHPDDDADIPNDLKAIVEWAAERSVMRFASTSERDILLSSPTEGQMCMTGSGTTLRAWLRKGGVWADLLTAIGGPTMYAVKGDGAYNLINATYDWMGAVSAWTAVGPASPPPQFSYIATDAQTYGQGLVANIGGLYRLSASVQYDANSTGYRFARVLKNTTIVKKTGGPAEPAGRHCLNIEATCYLTPGDRLGVQVSQTSGAPLALYSGEDSRSIVMAYLGP